MVATEGWAETSMLSAQELAMRFADAGVAAVIYTDIGRDGMLTGLNLPQTFALAAQIGIPVIASGGVGTVADLVALRDGAPLGVGGCVGGCVDGVVVGRALYDGRVGIAEALAVLAATRPALV